MHQDQGILPGRNYVYRCPDSMQMRGERKDDLESLARCEQTAAANCNVGSYVL